MKQFCAVFSLLFCTFVSAMDSSSIPVVIQKPGLSSYCSSYNYGEPYESQLSFIGDWEIQLDDVRYEYRRLEINGEQCKFTLKDNSILYILFDPAHVNKLP